MAILDHIIPITLVLTLAGALAIFVTNERMSRMVALVACAPALAITSMMLWQVGIGSPGEYQFYTKLD